MWQMSNSAACCRHQPCSAMIPSYWIGMSQPPNGASRACNCWCRDKRGVFFSFSMGFSRIEMKENKGLNLKKLYTFVNRFLIIKKNLDQFVHP